MDFINTSKQKIQDLNNRFFFVMENFVDNYVYYLKDPQNTNYKSEVERVFNTIANINNDSLILKNSIQTKISENNTKILQMNKDVDALKILNEELKTKAKKLRIQAITSEGMFNSELDWYKKQVLIFIILLVGIIYSLKLVFDLHLTNKQLIVTSIILLLLIRMYTIIVSYLS